MIYDTTYFLDLTKTERPSAFERGVELFEAGVPRRVPAHVVFELCYGVEAAGAGTMGYPIRALRTRRRSPAPAASTP